MAKKKNQPKKNLLMQIGVVILLIAFVAYFILSNVLVKNETSNKDLDKAVGSKTAFSFLKEGELLFTNSKGDNITKVDIEIADDDEQRATGLMYRDKMDENQGMLFLFDSEVQQAFWMKNTILPLDIIYVNAKMEIVSIQKNAEPFSEKSLPSIKPAQYVVEVNAGYCERHGIKDGDKIAWRKE
ncbi:MAG: DUF192 domain-containing protein [Ignavibacteriales bacterium]|nr:DUF192 domain-containing protein [Ignavibacteriales bacterium]